MNAQPIAVGDQEGGDWISWTDWCARPVPDHRGKRLHVVAFADGSILDMHSGWRTRVDHGACNCLRCRILANDFWATG